MISPLFLAFDAAHGAVRDALVGRSVVQYAGKKFFLVDEDADTLHALAAWPKPDLVEAIADQVCPADRCSEPQKPHSGASFKTGRRPKTHSAAQAEYDAGGAGLVPEVAQFPRAA